MEDYFPRVLESKMPIFMVRLKFKYLYKGDGLDCASQSNVRDVSTCPKIAPKLDRGGRRGGLLPTGSIK